MSRDYVPDAGYDPHLRLPSSLRRISDAHGSSLADYRRGVWHHWRWLLFSVILAGVGTAQVVFTWVSLPWWLWILLAVLALMWAQYKTFYDMREQREQAKRDHEWDKQKHVNDLAAARRSYDAMVEAQREEYERQLAAKPLNDIAPIMGTELRDIRASVESITADNFYPIGFHFPTSRWNECEEVLGQHPDVHKIVARVHRRASDQQGAGRV